MYIYLPRFAPPESQLPRRRVGGERRVSLRPHIQISPGASKINTNDNNNNNGNNNGTVIVIATIVIVIISIMIIIVIVMVIVMVMVIINDPSAHPSRGKLHLEPAPETTPLSVWSELLANFETYVYSKAKTQRTYIA